MFCKTCHTEKSISEFYKWNHTKCKDCVRVYARQYRLEHLEKIKEYDRNRPNAKERCKKQKEYKAKMKVENPEKYDKIFHGIRKRYRKNHSEADKAHNILNDALRYGKIKRPDKCVICQKECKPQAHHYDYSKPLDVMWLCVSCHSDIHKKERTDKRKNK